MTTLGRKRSFDKTEALEKAMLIFWDNGFAGTSISDLTEALDINKPSLYAAFGNKEQLFNAAIEHYVQQYGSQPLEQLKGQEDLTLSKRIEKFLLAVVANNTSSALPIGCFIVKSHCESGSKSLPEDTDNTLKDISINYEKILEEFLLSEQQQGRLSKAQNPKDIAAYLTSLTYGLSVMARRGKPCEELYSIVKTALNTLQL